MRILLDYPWYFALGCLLLGAAYAALLYWAKDGRSSLSRKLRWLLALLRTASVSLIAFLLLAPMAKHVSSETEKPIVLVAQDKSESVFSPELHLGTQEYYDGPFAQMIAQLEKDYDVQTFDYGDKTTDMSEILSRLQQQYDHRNVGALILTGDGLWNTGSNPASAAARSTYPIYTIALGDTARHRDASIADIRCGKIAYMGNEFPVEITVNASQLRGQHKRLTVESGGKTLYSKELSYDSDPFSTTEQIAIKAEKAGVQRYTVRIAAAEGEMTEKNNVRTFSIEVIDGHQKIAIIGASPHPDIAALKQSIESNQNYEAETFVAKDFKSDPKQYSLLILHQIPSRNGVRLNTGDTPCIYILGSMSDLAQFNALHCGLEIYTKLSKQSEATAAEAAGFSPFALSPETAKAIEAMPPLMVPFGEYRAAAGMQSLFTARIGSIDSKQPLIAVGQQNGIRRTIVAGEGLWRWRMSDYQANGSHDRFDELVNKLVVYTAMRADKQRFRLVAKSIYRQDENVTIEAELYDENYELTNAPEARLTVGGKEYLLNRSGDRYQLSLGQLPAEAYGCSAKVKYDGKDYTASCNFVVEDLNLEELNLTADHALMGAIAQQTGGQMLLPAQTDQLPELLKQRGDIKPVIYSRTSYSELIDLWWMLLLIIVLLGIEWVVRKYNGEI